MIKNSFLSAGVPFSWSDALIRINSDYPADEGQLGLLT